MIDLLGVLGRPGDSTQSAQREPGRFTLRALPTRGGDEWRRERSRSLGCPTRPCSCASPGAGTWAAACPCADAVERAIDGPPARRSAARVRRRGADRVGQLAARAASSASSSAAARRGVAVDTAGLPDGLRRLLALSEAAPGQRPPPPPAPLAVRSRASALRAIDRFDAFARGCFASSASWRSRSGASSPAARACAGSTSSPRSRPPARARSSIVAVVSFLLGMILAFVGAVHAAAVRRDASTSPTWSRSRWCASSAPVMTAIVMAGRTGSAYAAQLGTMKVTQEIDALTTMALPPMRLPGAAARARAVADDAAPRRLRRLHRARRRRPWSPRPAARASTQYARQVEGRDHADRRSGSASSRASSSASSSRCAAASQGLRAGKSAAAVGEAATARGGHARSSGSSPLDGVFAVVLNVLGI